MADRLQRRRKFRKHIHNNKIVGWSAWWGLVEGKKPHPNSQQALRLILHTKNKNTVPYLYTHGMTSDTAW